MTVEILLDNIHVVGNVSSNPSVDHLWVVCRDREDCTINIHPSHAGDARVLNIDEQYFHFASIGYAECDFINPP